MDTKVVNAVERLNKILPLAARRQQLDRELADVYQNILHSYVELGRSLNKNEIAEQVQDIDKAIECLRDNDMVVFDDEGEPTGAYPFTMEQREHEVIINGHSLHSMCALDALAISPMFGLETRINSRCHVSSKPVDLRQYRLDIIDADMHDDVFFGINWNSAANNCCATSLCTEMIFLKGNSIAFYHHKPLFINPINISGLKIKNAS